MKSTFIKIFNYLMMIIFLISVIIQYNDPDPFLWMAIYGIATIVCVLAVFGRLHWTFSALVALATFGAALFLAPQVIGNVAFIDMFESLQMQNEVVEKAREMGGLLIVAVWMMVLTIQLKQKFRKTQNSQRRHKDHKV